MLTTLIIFTLGLVFPSTSVQGLLNVPFSQSTATDSLAQLAIWESLGLYDADFATDDQEASNLLGVGPRPDYEKEVKFFLFTRNMRENGTEIYADSTKLRGSPANPNWPTKIIIHGFQNNIQSEFVVVLKNEYLDRDDYNIIGVDWGYLAKPPNYIAARSHSIGVANRTAKLLDALADADISLPPNQHVIGHSLGAQIAGMASGQAKSRPGRCTGLDPAGPLFQLSTKEGRIDPSDADLVDIVHTSAAFWGFPGPLGHVDFYPNGGVWPQPGCLLDIDGSCSHAMAFYFFAYTIKNPLALNGTLCQTPSIVEGDCPLSSDYASLGDQVHFTTPGMYYLDFKLPSQFTSGVNSSSCDSAASRRSSSQTSCSERGRSARRNREKDRQRSRPRRLKSRTTSSP